MDSLRIILLIIGVVFIAAIYLWETRWRRRSRDLSDLDTTFLDELGEQRSRRDFGYSRTPHEDSEVSDTPETPSEHRPTDQEALPFKEDEPADADGFGINERGPDSAPADVPSTLAAGPTVPQDIAQFGPQLGELDLIIPNAIDDDGVSEQINRLEAFSAATASTTNRGTAEPGLVIALTLMARGGERFGGATLRVALEELGFRHGRMQVFHHYDRLESGRRVPLCSVANVVNPGTFELDSMDESVTPGLALFMQVSGHEAENAKLDRMLQLGGELAQRLGGELLDETRSTLTNQAINHLRERIAEFARLQRLRL